MKVPCITIIVIGLTVVNASIQDQYSDHRNNFGPNNHPNNHGHNHHGRNHPNNHGQNHPNNFNCPDYIQIALENTARALAHEVAPAQAIKQEMERQFKSDDWYIFSVKNSKIQDVSFAFDHDWDDKVCAIQVGYDVHVLIHED